VKVGVSIIRVSVNTDAVQSQSSERQFSAISVSVNADVSFVSDQYTDTVTSLTDPMNTISYGTIPVMDLFSFKEQLVQQPFYTWLLFLLLSKIIIQ
jgi:hypothetical protein